MEWITNFSQTQPVAWAVQQMLKSPGGAWADQASLPALAMLLRIFIVQILALIFCH